MLLASTACELLKRFNFYSDTAMSVFKAACRYITGHELLNKIRDNCVVRIQPFLYRLKRGHAAGCSSRK